MARPRPASRSHSRRSDELFAAFNGPADTDPSLPDYAQASSSSSAVRPSTDVFFDAGDALPEPDNAAVNDPLGADRANTNTNTPSTFRPPPLFNRSGNTPAYDFERPEYFPTATRRPPPSSTPTTPRTETAHSNNNNDDHRTIDMSFQGGDEADDSTHSGSGSQVHRNGYSSLPTASGGVSADASQHLSRTDRLRFALGRFGRFVGMGIPGARYPSLSQQDRARAGVHRPRVVGGGIGQDGVFANLSAKPERRRRGHNARGTDDRGDDDDLEDDMQPPTYEIAAADAVPQYWETTILGGSVHPLANGLGWTPGGAHVGAIEDLIVEGLAVGNFFGFAWNLLVSMTFQFVGFLLTYLLHTTHAARCGSRAGLGVTLIQYGFYLRTRAAEIAEGKVIGSGDFGGGGGAFSAGAGAGNGWFGEDVDAGDGSGARRRRGWSARTVQPTQPTVDGATLADLFAAQADGQPVNVGGESITDSMSQSTEWLAYVLMVLGWTILLSSMLSYWRIWRWGKSLVDAARREQQSSAENSDSNNDASGGASTPATGATGFINRFRSALSSRSVGSGRGSGEDWILFPGVGHRLGRTSAARRPQDRSASFDHPTSIADLEDEEGLDTEDARLNPAERRLLNDMRRVGLA
ncbi:related to BSD2-metal homeostasis protein [Sporisorium reilianum SRZ2]|uniref:Related to BSD2-metal homeostasis protein n=1 Tax=Sporisorium reilianum (strain SRZ2) TaxID=999809 RepID=E7A1U8_SPORE|nr:related to BSD2-metal homeostasis protein [Sporisorium reilianum SRZ2]